MVVVTRKFQVTIPREVRNALGVQIGDEVVFLPDGDDGFRLMKASDFVERFYEDSKDIESTIKEVRSGMGKRFPEEGGP